MDYITQLWLSTATSIPGDRPKTESESIIILVTNCSDHSMFARANIQYMLLTSPSCVDHK